MNTGPVARDFLIKKPDRKVKLFVDARWLTQPGQGVYTYLCEVYRRLSRDHGDAFEICYGCVGDAVPDFLSGSDRVLTYASDALARTRSVPAPSSSSDRPAIASHAMIG